MSAEPPGPRSRLTFQQAQPKDDKPASSTPPRAPQPDRNNDSPALTFPLSAVAIRCAQLRTSTINSFCGAMAGIASGVVTCPLDVIKTRLQAQGSFRRGMANSRSQTAAIYQGLVSTARTIWTQDGIRGMYRGLGPMVLGYLPTWAVYMSVYDASKEYYYAEMGMKLALDSL